METQRGPSFSITGYIARNRLGLACFFCIAALGCRTGYALFCSVFMERVLGLLAGLSGMSAAGLRPLPALIGGLLPPVLLGAGMLLCSFSRWALPLWGVLVFLESSRWGMGAGLLHALCRAGAAFVAHATVLPALLCAALSACLLSMQPLERLRRPRDPFGFDDVAGDVLSTAILALLTATVGTLLASLSAALCTAHWAP